jgi:hypothetical protein
VEDHQGNVVTVTGMPATSGELTRHMEREEAVGHALREPARR